MSATAKITAAQNRLKMTVAFRFINTKREEDDYKKTIPSFTTSPLHFKFMT